MFSAPTLPVRSLLFGNIFVFYMFMGKDVIDAGTRLVVFAALTGVALLGLAILLALPKPGAGGSGRQDDMGGPLDALKKSFELFKTRDMILLSATFFYTGDELLLTVSQLFIFTNITNIVACAYMYVDMSEKLSFV